MPTARRQSGSVSLAANALGRAWSLVANVIMFPVYLRLLGEESFGIVAMLTAVTAIVALFDFGLSPVLARELHHQGRDAGFRRDLLRSAESVLLLVVLIVGLIVWFMPDGPLAALVKGDAARSVGIASALRGVFLVAAAQLMFTFYVNAISGIEAQVQSNMMSVGASLVRSVGVVLPLLYWPTIDAFLLWQLGASVLGVLLSRHVLYSLLPRPGGDHRARASLRQLGSYLPAAGASFLLALAATLNMNLDKILVGKFEGLRSIGEYSITATFAQLIFVASVPISLTVTPRMVRAVTSNDGPAFDELLAIARSAIGLLASILLVFGAWHGPAVIEHWSAGSVQAAQIQHYMVWLLIGSACLALSSIYHCVAMAHMDFSFGRPYAVSTLLSVPIYGLAIGAGGVAGAATAWGSVQVCVMVAYIAWVGRRHLPLGALSAFPWLGLGAGALAAALAITMMTLAVGSQGLGGLRLSLLILAELALTAVIAAALLALVWRKLGVEDPLARRIDLRLRRLLPP
jgi:O-antigen/teichoic acid export membrane protein